MDIGDKVRLLYLEFALEFGAVSVEHGEVEGAEVGVEVLVDQLLVDGEVVRVRRRLGPHRRLYGRGPLIYDVCSERQRGLGGFHEVVWDGGDQKIAKFCGQRVLKM